MSAPCGKAAALLDRRLYFDRLDSRYGELRGDADAWAEIEAERAREERSLDDRSA